MPTCALWLSPCQLLHEGENHPHNTSWDTCLSAWLSCILRAVLMKEKIGKQGKDAHRIRCACQTVFNTQSGLTGPEGVLYEQHYTTSELDAHDAHARDNQYRPRAFSTLL